MRTLSSLLGAVVLATTAYAAEPTLQTTPDYSSSFVQENADKALKVAYIVAGNACSVGNSGGGATTSSSVTDGKQMYSAQLIVDTAEQTYNIIVLDMLTNNTPDRLLMLVYNERVSVDVAARGSAKSITISDQGLDGHVNSGVDKVSSFGRQYIDFNSPKAKTSGKEHEPYFQDIYLKALDAVIAACEAKQ